MIKTACEFNLMFTAIKARLTLQTDYCMFAADKTARNKPLSLHFFTHFELLNLLF